MSAEAGRAFALIGPGRAGTTVAVALSDAGWRVVAVAGRNVESASARSLADRLSSRVAPVVEVARDADLVVIATPDAAIESTAREIAEAVRAGALVVHLSGARGVDAFGGARRRGADVHVGALHPLQTLPGPLEGAWAAVAGPDAVTELALELGLRPFHVDDRQRAAYHATACIASNHLVAVLGQVERLATQLGVPSKRSRRSARATVNNVVAPGAAMRSPVRSRVATTTPSPLTSRAARRAARAYRGARERRRSASPVATTPSSRPCSGA